MTIRPSLPDPKIHPSEPFADGICFDDLNGMTDRQRNLLAARGVVFVTSFKSGGRFYGGTIIATSWPGAEEIAFSRGLGELVEGVLVETGQTD